MAHEETLQDSVRVIDLNDSAQIAQWCRDLGCTEIELREAVRMVGPSRMSVQQWIAWLHLR